MYLNLRRDGALPWLIALLTAGIYLPALSASFQFDDWQVVLGDARVASLAAWWESMPGMRALVKLSYALNHTWGGSAASFRAVNILLHALNAALVFVLVRRLAARLGAAGSAGTTPVDGARLEPPTTVALVAALVFALHPVQTESVTYIAARSNLIATVFSLASLLAWMQGRERHAPRWWTLSALCYVAALAGKETAAVTPLAMLLILAAEGRLNLRTASLPAVLVAMLGLLLLLAWPHFPYDYLLRTSLETRAPLENLLAQGQAVGWLATQLVRWDLLNADPALVPAGAWGIARALQAAVLLALALTGVLALRRRPALGFGILWFFLWLAPTNSLLARLDLANDRQLYLAIVGPGWCIGHAIAHLARMPSRIPVWIPVSTLVLLLAWGTLARNRVYDTETTFWSDVVAKSPHNTRAWNNLGMARALDCDAVGAERAFTRAMELAPEGPLAEINLALLQQGGLPGVPAHCRQSAPQPQ